MTSVPYSLRFPSGNSFHSFKAFISLREPWEMGSLRRPYIHLLAPEISVVPSIPPRLKERGGSVTVNRCGVDPGMLVTLSETADHLSPINPFGFQRLIV